MKNTRLLLLLTALLITLYACKKESIADLTKSASSTTINNSTEASESHIFNFGGNSAHERGGNSSDNPTILGDLRVNPYTVEKMTLAYNTINTVQVAEVATTNLYVQFCPTTIEEAAELFDTNLNLYDFPLEYEVLEMGDSYTDPSLGPDDIPCFYAIVRPGYSLPSYGSLLDRLHLSPYESELTKESFEQTGNDYQGLTDCDKYAPNWPDCQCDEFLDNQPAWEECIAMINSTNNGCDGSGPNWPECLCDGYPSGSVEQQDCLDNLDYTPPPPDPNANCLNYHTRMPSGYVRVQDTQTGTMEGVRQVKVILKDDWFTEDEVWTNDAGCFRLTSVYSKKNTWMWVKWKSDRCKIRGVENGEVYPWEHLQAVKDYIDKFKKPPYNNIQVNYYYNSTTVPYGSKSHIRWAASTVNNAVHDFHDHAADDGILPPPGNLNIYLSKGNNSYALLTTQIGPSEVAQAIMFGLLATAAPPGLNFIELTWPLVLPGYGITQLVLIFYPDVQIGLEGETTSDQLKHLAFHEIAHTSHYNFVGPHYWLGVVAAEVAANGHGDPNSYDAGRIAVAESWGEHIALTYADREYPTNGLTSFIGTYVGLLELTVNESLNHIPIGLYHDLIDNGIEPTATGVNDAVTGFTNSQMFSALVADTPEGFIQNMIDEYLNTTSNTEAQVNDLFNSY